MNPLHDYVRAVWTDPYLALFSAYLLSFMAAVDFSLS